MQKIDYYVVNWTPWTKSKMSEYVCFCVCVWWLTKYNWKIHRYTFCTQRWNHKLRKPNYEVDRLISKWIAWVYVFGMVKCSFSKALGVNINDSCTPLSTFHNSCYIRKNTPHIHKLLSSAVDLILVYSSTKEPKKRKRFQSIFALLCDFSIRCSLWLCVSVCFCVYWVFIVGYRNHLGLLIW